jgi:hypothetical protein
MKISLIITCYKRIDLLRNALLSIKSLNFKPYELIISDDGSEEDVISGIKDVINDFEFPLKFVKQQDRGFRLARCRNNAVRISEGEYLIFIDQDLMFSKGFWQQFALNIKRGYFIVGYPIRLTKEQSDLISEKIIVNCDYNNIITKAQKNKIISQFNKDKFYRIFNSIGLRKYGTKFRGGIAGMFKQDYIRINGYDENFIGWGNEDDDFGRRLYASGIKGLNPFKKVFPLHHWHKENHDNGKRLNRKYNEKQKNQINSRNFTCIHGYENSLGNDKVKVIKIFNYEK